MRSTRCVLIPAALLVLAAPGAFARDSTPLPTDAAYLKAFKEAILSAHNTYRAKHQAPALKWDDELAAYARTRAASRAQQEGLNAGHSGLRKGTGENLFWSGTSQSTPPAAREAAKMAIDSWYNEVKSYNYAKGGFSPATGHFTQVIWKNTMSVGCAIHHLKGGKWLETYVVCNYSPAGNYVGQFPQNVLPPKK